MEKEGALNIGKLPVEGLPRNSVILTSAVYHGRKTLNQTNKQLQFLVIANLLFLIPYDHVNSPEPSGSQGELIVYPWLPGGLM